MLPDAGHADYGVLVAHHAVVSVVKNGTAANDANVTNQFPIHRRNHYAYGQVQRRDQPGPNCPECNAESAFCNSVDQTNGPSQGELRYPQDFAHLLVRDAVWDTCPHCQHTKLISAAVYRIPTHLEMQSYRHYYDECAGWNPETGMYPELPKGEQNE